jgi:hypothetical protein
MAIIIEVMARIKVEKAFDRPRFTFAILLEILGRSSTKTFLLKEPRL